MRPEPGGAGVETQNRFGKADSLNALKPDRFICSQHRVGGTSVNARAVARFWALLYVILILKEFNEELVDADCLIAAVSRFAKLVGGFPRR